MTPTQAQEIVTAACVAANPDIMKLEFGCNIYHSQYGKAIIKEVQGTGNGSTQKFYTNRSHKFYTDKVEGSKIYRDFSGGKENGEWWEILGRDLTLADVLLAFHKGNETENPQQFWLVIGENGEFAKMMLHTGELVNCNITWNLRLPFHLQEDETKIFIATLFEK